MMKRWIDIAADRLSLAVGWWLLLYSIAVCIEVASRKFFGKSFQGIDELGGYTLAISAAMGYSIALLRRSHTRVDFVLTKLSARGQCALNTIAMLLLAAMALFFVDGAWRVLGESIEFQARSTTPLQIRLAIPQALWFAGLAMFALTALLLAFEAVTLAMRAPADVNRHFGPPSLQDEIRSEAGLDVEIMQSPIAVPAGERA